MAAAARKERRESLVMASGSESGLLLDGTYHAAWRKDFQKKSPSPDEWRSTCPNCAACLAGFTGPRLSINQQFIRGWVLLGGMDMVRLGLFAVAVGLAGSSARLEAGDLVIPASERILPGYRLAHVQASASSRPVRGARPIQASPVPEIKYEISKF